MWISEKSWEGTFALLPSFGPWALMTFVKLGWDCCVGQWVTPGQDGIGSSGIERESKGRLRRSGPSRSAKYDQERRSFLTLPTYLTYLYATEVQVKTGRMVRMQSGSFVTGKSLASIHASGSRALWRKFLPWLDRPLSSWGVEKGRHAS